MKYYKKKIGSLGEDVAVNYLIQNKYQIIERNFRCKSGEIDIIAKDGGYIVFIEVKTRRNDDFGTPLEAISYSKVSKITKTAQFYLMYNNMQNNDIRFDAIEIIGELENEKLVVKSVDLIKNAF